MFSTSDRTPASDRHKDTQTNTHIWP